MSRGTIEQIYFALRMAAVDVLGREELPVILMIPLPIMMMYV